VRSAPIRTASEGAQWSPSTYESPAADARNASPTAGPEQHAGRRKQLDDLYRRHRPSVYRRCRRMLAVDAEDAVQEVFLRLAATLDRMPPSPDVSFWIQRVATNYCLNEIRNRRRRRRLQEDSVVHEPAIPRHPADIQDARATALQIMLKRPERVIAAAFLYHVEGLTQEDAARELGLSRRTIVTYLTALRRRAMKVFEAT
jgi:RNA polymerase sigma-70 factor, ECF subfamily